MLRRLVAGLVLGQALVARGTEAQGADSSIFRAKQWGAEFNAGSGFSGAGILRFLTSRRALVLDVTGQITRSQVDGFDTDNDYSSVQLRLGHRWYRVVQPRVMQSATLGVAVNREHVALQSDANGSGSGQGGPSYPFGMVDQRAIDGGVFGEVGAGWMVASHLSLGASWGGTVTYGTRETESRVEPTPATVRGQAKRWRAGVGALALRLSLYF